MAQEIAVELAKFAVETQLEDIPRDVLEFAKALTLKTTAGILVGSKKSSGKKMATLVRNRRLPGDVGAIGSGFKTSLWDAALLHGFFAHASELEDDRFGKNPSGWDITVVPPVLSVAEKYRLSGKALLEALIVGLEVHIRTSLFTNPYMEVMTPTGAMGAAAAASRAMGSSVEETTAALGLAMSSSPLTMANFGTDAHFFESSLHCWQGTLAAEMAKVGMTGNPAVGKYLSRYFGKDRVNPQEISADLGQRWLFADIWIKKYPCCFMTHRQIDALIELRKQHSISFADVVTIEMHGGPSDVVCDRSDPKTEGDMQFSYQHVLGAAMLDGDVELRHFTLDQINDARLKDARLKVKVILHPDWPKEFPQAPCKIVIKVKDGREFSRERMYAVGSPEEPLTLAQVSALYQKFTSGILSDRDISRTSEDIMGLDKLSDISKLMEALTFNSLC